MKLTLGVMADSRLLTERARAELADFAAQIAVKPSAVIIIEGYTASDNATAENIELSERRANLVKDIMVERGVDESQITAIGRGVENPKAGNDSRAGRAMNRRVEISVQ